jgi:hypothetical protein
MLHSENKSVKEMKSKESRPAGKRKAEKAKLSACSKAVLYSEGG